MKKPELLHKTIGILVNAYLNDTLEHGNCYACAVGNIVAANMRISFTEHEGTPVWNSFESPWWDLVFCTRDKYFKEQTIAPENYTEEAKEQIDSTGYRWQDLAKVEKAFESAFDYRAPEHINMFNGLMAVVDKLCEIHEMDVTAKEEAKALFVKSA